MMTNHLKRLMELVNEVGQGHAEADPGLLPILCDALIEEGRLKEAERVRRMTPPRLGLWVDGAHGKKWVIYGLFLSKKDTSLWSGIRFDLEWRVYTSVNWHHDRRIKARKPDDVHGLHENYPEVVADYEPARQRELHKLVHGYLTKCFPLT